MILRILKWLGFAVLGGITLLVVSNCTMLGLNYASLETDRKPLPSPAISAQDASDWEAQRAGLKAAFEGSVYGPWPKGLSVSIGETRVADAAYLDGRAVLEETPITLGRGAGARTFHFAIAWPKQASGPVPVVIFQSFSNNCLAFQSTQLTAPEGGNCTQTEFGGFAGWAVTSIFGEYIASQPVGEFIDRGYAYGSFYASEIVPDSKAAAYQSLESLRASEGVASTGAIAVWAFGYSAVIDMLDADTRADPARTAVWGHSRHGKAALVAAAWDTRIELVFSHQSGFGGGSLSRSTTGEGLGGVTGAKGGFGGGYPYWFAPEYGAFADDLDALPVDQHQLIALIAPRAVMLGNGRRDVWSDPNSSYRAAQGASVVWRLYGSPGLEQGEMRDFRAGADLVFYMRAGGHGIVAADIAAFLEFLDSHFAEAELAWARP